MNLHKLFFNKLEFPCTCFFNNIQTLWPREDPARFEAKECIHQLIRILVTTWFHYSLVICFNLIIKKMYTSCSSPQTFQPKRQYCWFRHPIGKPHSKSVLVCIVLKQSCIFTGAVSFGFSSEYTSYGPVIFDLIQKTSISTPKNHLKNDRCP